MALNDVKEIKIPDDTYELLEYIHFNGNDYIDSGFTPWNNFSYYLDIQWDEGAVSQFSGHGKVVSNNRCFIGTESNGKVMFGTGAYSATISNSNVYERHNYLVRTGPSSGTGVFDIDGVQQWYGASNFVESDRGTMFIGGVYRSTGDYSLCKAKIYNVRFTNNASTATTWTWNLIPVRRKADGVIGFLKLKANKTTPDFMTSVNGLLEAGPVVGPYMVDVNKIEDSNGNIIWGSQSAFPYRRLDYIHFSGAEGIDLGFKPASSGNMGVQAVKARITGPTASSSYGVILGCAGDSAASGGSMRVLVQSAGGLIGQRVGRNSSTFGYSTAMNTNDFYSFRLRTTSNSSTYIDIYNASGQLISGTNHTTSVSYTSANMPNENLMRYNSGGSIVSNGYSTGDIAFFKQWDGSQATGTLIKDMYPCQRKSDSVCGLYDVLNSRFYPIAGTNITTSAAGPVVDEYWNLQA